MDIIVIVGYKLMDSWFTDEKIPGGKLIPRNTF